MIKWKQWIKNASKFSAIFEKLMQYYLDYLLLSASPSIPDVNNFVCTSFQDKSQQSLQMSWTANGALFLKCLILNSVIHSSLQLLGWSSGEQELLLAQMASPGHAKVIFLSLFFIHLIWFSFHKMICLQMLSSVEISINQALSNA